MHTETVIRVRYAETDALGIAYHANFFPWFEEGRTDYMEALGFSYRKLEADGLFLPLTDCRCRFITAARYADRLTVRTRLEGVRGAALTMAYDVVRSDDGKAVARGATTHVFVDRSFRPVNWRRLRPDLWEAMTRQMEDGRKAEP